MKKNKLYRVGSALLAALMVVTCVPQTGLYVAAEELPMDAEMIAVAQETETPQAQSDSVEIQQEEASVKTDTVPTSQENAEGNVTPQEDPVVVDPTGIRLDKPELSMQREDRVTLTATVEPANATNKAVIWSSDNENVATVSNGTVLGKAVGLATITAMVKDSSGNEFKAMCDVKVNPIPVTDVIFDKTSLKMKTGDAAATLTVTVLPANADNKNVTLRTNYNTEVITATHDSATNKITVTAKKAGTTDLVVVSQDNTKIYASCEIEVEGTDVALTSVSAKTGYPENLYVGKSINLKQYISYTPVNATDKTLKWTTNNSDYVDVDQNGRVTAKWKSTDNGSSKEVEIYAVPAPKEDTSGSTGDTGTTYADSGAPTNGATFTIKIKRSSVALDALHVDPKELVLEDGGRKKSQTICVQLDPLASTDREITATVSKETDATKTAVLINAGSTYDAGKAAGTAKAEADVNGRVYFTVTANALEELKKQDTCKITFSASTVTVECNVTVNKFVTPVEKLDLPQSFVMRDGETASLKAVIGPQSAEDSHIVWTVSDSEIVSITDGVDADGRIEATTPEGDDLSATVKITAHMVGECIITATAAGDVEKQCKVTVKQAAADPATGLTIKSKLGGTEDVETAEITLKKGQEYTLVPEVAPNTAANKKVKWSSGSPDVASVEKGTNKDGTKNENGIVKANALGVCEITAQASGESSACTKTVRVNVVDPHMEVSYPADWSYRPEDQPITEAKLRGELEVSFWPVVNPVPDKDKITLGSDKTYNYELWILKEDGKTEKTYEPEDMQKPGKKVLVISYTYDDVTYKESVPIEMKEFDEADLISVTPLSGEDAEVWNVPSGTPKSSLPLAQKTEILVGRKVLVAGQEELKTATLDAEIAWDVDASGYDPADAEAQEFTVFGDVVLDPNRVKNPNNVSLRVQAKVHVREYASSGKKTVRPSFSVLGGQQVGNNTTVTVPYGSKIVIETVTEEADIYYMIDRRPDEERGVPQDEEHKYTSPIEITAKTTTIYAIAVKHGFDDSDCSECTVKLIQAQEIDPDDPDAPLPDDVTDEDRAQVGGKVPDGLWAVVQMDADEKDGFAYTGTAIKPAVHVYDRTMLLTEKTDYTIAYSNNINAGSAKGSAKPPTITVTGKGNYEGKALVYFTIKPQSIEDDSVFMNEYVAVAYNKKAQKPNPSLTWNGKKLSKNKDYTYADVSYTQPGIYNVTVEGKGNYTGTRTMGYEIYDGGVAVSKLTVSKIANYKYTGSEIRPEVTVKYKNTVLAPGTEKGSGNYWIKYENCTKVGTASLVIIGKGNYKGSKRINFKILPVAKISQAGITLDVPAAGVAYTGKQYTPKCTVNYLGTELKENKDYKLNYQNNTKAGTATVVITGIGAYSGTAKKTFKILQNDISGIAAVMGTSFVYEKGGCKPKPTVSYNNMKLTEGTDYTLTYKNNNKIGNTASVTVKGKGNYKGQIIRYFEVTMQDISNLKVVANDRAYQQKKNIYKTKVQVIDLNGMPLVAGTDYAKDIYYTYESGTKAGQPVLSTDIIPVGTVIGVDVRVTNPRCYQGTAHGTYRIVQADISGAKVSINPQEYTGRSIRPKKNQIQVTVNGVLLGNDDYEIVGYENNVKQGNAKITIRGVGSYGGTKTATFKIKKKGILNLKF